MYWPERGEDTFHAEAYCLGKSHRAYLKDNSDQSSTSPFSHLEVKMIYST